MTPILPIANGEKERAKRIATALIAEIEKGIKTGSPIGEWCLEICKIFKIPVLPSEDARKVAKAKLIEWRLAVGYGMVATEEIQQILPGLTDVLGNRYTVTGLQGAIASELKTRQERRESAIYRQYKRRNNPAPPLYFSDDPYED